MKISYRWLKETVDIPVAPDQLAKDLTNCGLVVDTVDVGSSDTILELDLTTNRPDCLSHWGVAREVSTLYQSPLRKRVVKVEEFQPVDSSPVSVRIVSPQLCRRYATRVIQGVTVGASPDWLRERLNSLGIRPLNNVVDATNYVLMEIGHPTHAFDLAKIQNTQILVRQAQTGEKLLTLDGIQRYLDSGMLLITDPVKPLALAGIMGGEESEISVGTRDILVESAWFDPISVRKTAKVLGLHTEASHRFERGADVEAILPAINRVAQLIQQLAGGKILGNMIDQYPQPLRRNSILLRRARLSQLIGLEIDPQKVERILNFLEFTVLKSLKDGWTVSLPTARMDVDREIDLVEEVARHYGYSNLPPTLPSWRSGAHRRPHQVAEKIVTDKLVNLGYSETLTYPFVDEKDNLRFSSNSGVALLNPLSSETGVMRTSLIPGLLASLSWNYNRSIRSIRLFEIGKIYGWDKLGKPREELRLAMLVSGNLQDKSIHVSSQPFTFFDVKGDIQVLLGSLSILSQAVQFKISNTGVNHWHPGIAGEIWLERTQLGFLGQLHPAICEEYKVKQPVYIAEVWLSVLFPFWKATTKMKIIPRFPSIQRDLSILVDQSVAYAEIESVIWSTGIQELSQVLPFDLYQGDQVGSGKKGISVTLVYQRLDRTLVEEEATCFQQKVLFHLRDKLGAQLRS